MGYLALLALWICLSAASPVSAQTSSSDVSATNLRTDGLFWYTVTSAGALYDKAGPYALSGCVSQSPVSTTGLVDVGGYYILSGFWSSEFSGRLNHERGEVIVSSWRPGVFRLHGNYPNPFRLSTRIAYDLPTGSNVCLSVYDAGGRSIKELVGGWQEAGQYSLNWDGRDKMGRTCPAGVYFCSLKTEHQKAMRKMVVAE
jgi:hypothetical protein